ncbi:hypothetical protein CLOM_g6476, partial [Closterium sp. NIES-68]
VPTSPFAAQPLRIDLTNTAPPAVAPSAVSVIPWRWLSHSHRRTDKLHKKHAKADKNREEEGEEEEEERDRGSKAGGKKKGKDRTEASGKTGSGKKGRAGGAREEEGGGEGEERRQCRGGRSGEGACG